MPRALRLMVAQLGQFAATFGSFQHQGPFAKVVGERRSAFKFGLRLGPTV